MNFNLINPLSSKFLQVLPDKVQTREMTAKLNSYGVGEDTLDLSKYIRGITGQAAPAYPFEQNNIIFDTVFSSKRQRINFYRNMALYAFVKKMLNIIVGECCSRTVTGEVAKFDIVESQKKYFTNSEFDSLKKEFDWVINSVIKKSEIKALFRKWLIDGEIFLEICLNDEKNCVAGIKVLPPYCTLCVYEEGVLTGFVQDPSLVDPSFAKKELKTFTRNEIAYANYGKYYGNNLNDVRGHLEAAIKPINQLRAIQDAQTVYFIVRAPEKRIWRIYGGQMATSRQPEYLQQIISQYRRDLNLDPTTGLVVGSANTQAMTQDIWFMQDRNGQGSTVDTLKGSTEFQGAQEAISSFKEDVADALEVPGTRWKGEPGSSQYVQGLDGLSLDESQFQKRCQEFSERFADVIMQIFMVQLQVAGYEEKYLDSALYDISLIPATDTVQFRALAMAEKRTGILGTVSTMLPTRGNIKDDSDEAPPIFAKQFVFENMLGYKTDEWKKNEDMLAREIAELKKKVEAAKAEGGDESEEVEEGDMDY